MVDQIVRINFVLEEFLTAREQYNAIYLDIQSNDDI